MSLVQLNKDNAIENCENAQTKKSAGTNPILGLYVWHWQHIVLNFSMQSTEVSAPPHRGLQMRL
jgi:hypothetical protein